jgi:ABC-type nitrate/sulfonate/bicarbonate transport system substrate-binding protein
MVVNQSAGEAASVRDGQIHSLGAAKAYVRAHPDVIRRVTRAIARAQTLLKRDAATAIDAIVKAGITQPTPEHLKLIVDLYRPAVPATPRVSAAAIERNASLYPARPTMPDFTKVRAADFVDARFADAVAASGKIQH